MWSRLVLLISCLLLVSAYHPYHHKKHTILEIAESNPDLSILVTLLKRVGLDDVLDDKKGEFTVFAPTNKAFLHFLKDVDVDKLPKDAIRQLLLYHVLPCSKKTSSFKNDELLQTLTEKPRFVRFNRYNHYKHEIETVNGVVLHPKNIKASNGYVNIIDEVLIAPNSNIYEIIDEKKKLSTLFTAIKIAGLEDVFKDEKLSLTLFAPTNKAFEKIKDLDKILYDADKLRDILLYHVLASTYYSVGLQDDSYVTLNGEKIHVTNEKGKIRINEKVKIIKEDINALNGVVHIIDKVLIPPKRESIYDIVKKNPKFSILEYLIKRVKLVDELKKEELTVFAPTNKAFEKFLGRKDPHKIPDEAILDILLYHVLPGARKTFSFKDNELLKTLGGKDVRFNRYKHYKHEIETVNGVELHPKNIKASNGYVNVIDEVLCPPTKTIWKYIKTNPEFSILKVAIVKADLVHLLKDKDAALTLFAPTDFAFQKLIETLGGNVDEILKDKKALLRILTYHVLDDVYYSIGLKDGDYKTLEGSSIEVDNRRKKIILNDRVKVIKKDINVKNGVIHAIDKVLVPPDHH